MAATLGPNAEQVIDDDLRALHKMGCAQELARRMHGFSDFAVSFSIICVLAGGITSFQVGSSTTGGFGVGVGWLVGGIFALIVGTSIAQIASAHPTAGGLYHRSSILGERGWGWATAWINLLGLIFIIASVNVGVYWLFDSLVLGNIFHVDTTRWGYWQQVGGVTLIAGTQGLFNHFGIKLASRFTDFSGYLIFVVAMILTMTMLYSVGSFDMSRLFHFVNFTGAAGDGVVPRPENGLLAFALGLLLPIYTITGFDGSAYISEETINARAEVSKGIINSIFWSLVMGYVMACSFVLAMPDPVISAKDGANVFLNLLAGLPVGSVVKNFFYIAIVISNYLCALACVTSTSRMVYAFARDGGLPGSKYLRQVSPRYRTPLVAIWISVILSVAATLYSPAFAALAAGCAVFLYVSYAMPIAAGLFAEFRSWTQYGPFCLGLWSKPLAIITVLGVVVLCYVGIQPPNEILISYVLGALGLLVVGWVTVGNWFFKGPPIGDIIKSRGAEIAAREQAVGGAA